MGIFDRFRSDGQASKDDKNMNEAAEQGAIHLIEKGQAHEAENRIDEALQCYLEAIQLAPTLARAHLNHGNALLAKGDLNGALEAFRTAIRHRPDYAGAYYNMGNALVVHGRFDESVASYRKALEIKPDYAEVHCSLGVALRQLNKFDDAVANFQRALKFNPDLVEARTNLGLALGDLYNRGNALLNAGKYQDAITSLSRALEIEPNLAEAHYNLGNAQHELGQTISAVASYQRALKLKPDYAEAHNNLGTALKKQGKFAEAETSYKRALAIKPDFADAYNNLGVVLLDLGRHEEAVASYMRALEINPSLSLALCNLGSALKEQGKLDEANACYRRALEIEPDNVQFRVAQTFSIPVAPQTEAASIAVPLDFDQSLQNLSEWMLNAPVQREQLAEALGMQPTFYLAYRNGNHAARLSRFGDMLVGSTPQPMLNPAPKRDKLRLVVVSNHFRRHSVWDVILKGILINIDRTRFEVVLYNVGHIEDDETKLAKSQADIWRDSSTVAGLNGWLNAMAADQPDVVFYPEIGMDDMTLRLATRRLAPLQAASWGHPITTGLPTIDLYFSGDLLEAPDADEHYRERLVRLPGTGCCTTPIGLVPEQIPQLAAELANRRGPRFVIAQTPFKFDPADDGLFASIAAAVGECTFIICGDQQLSWAMDLLIARLSKAFYERNLDPKLYLLVTPWVPREKFYTLLDMSDVFLECLSFSGYTTAWQAVQRGLPVVTLEGKFMRQRLAAGLLRKIGITDTIATTADNYVSIAARLAAECRDPARRDARRRALKAVAPLADNDVSVVRSFEQNLIDALAERAGADEAGTTGNTHLTSSTQTNQNMNPTFEPAWKMLDADLHLHTLDPNYAPVGLLEMVNPAPKRVLDLGCFCGGSGRWLKQRFPDCEVIGIEMLGRAAAIAAQTYDRVINSTLEQVDFEKEGLKPGSFDAIIAADVLEHIYNPWQALLRLKPLLAPGGAIYISLPNVRNLNVLSSLASGEWRYEGAGILDVTHIRFFTLAQAGEMLTQTGWAIGDTRTNPDPRLTPLFEGKNLSEIKTINMGNLKLDGLKQIDIMELMAVQFFIRAEPMQRK